MDSAYEIGISIHVLRVEDDFFKAQSMSTIIISIHVLRVEDDWARTLTTAQSIYFNPRPPCGGRLDNMRKKLRDAGISIHVLRVEDDLRGIEKKFRFP